MGGRFDSLCRKDTDDDIPFVLSGSSGSSGRTGPKTPTLSIDTSTVPPSRARAHDGLDDLFAKYMKIGLEEEGEEGYEEADEEDDFIGGEGILAFCRDLGLKPEDALVLVIFFKLGVEEQYKISRDEFLKFRDFGWSDLRSIKRGVKQFKSVLSNTPQFRPFYKYCFGYMKPPSSRVMPNALAVQLWKVVLHGRYKKLEEWSEFVQNDYKRPITRDLWDCFLDFIETVTDFDRYDSMEGAWPTALDSFVEKMQERGS